MKLDIQRFGLDQYLRSSNGDEIYWRKANQIQGFFEETNPNCGENCKSTRVSKKTLERLLRLCKEVQADPASASALLPTTPGFFFGSYEYDEWYFQQIEDTIKELEDLLSKHMPGTRYYYYIWY